MPGALDPQELLVRAMIGQQITVAAARTALTQLSAAGAPAVSRRRAGPDVPHAGEIAAAGHLLRGPQRRTEALLARCLSHGGRTAGFRLRR